jgi:hypothetical protein
MFNFLIHSNFYLPEHQLEYRFALFIHFILIFPTDHVIINKKTIDFHF